MIRELYTSITELPYFDLTLLFLVLMISFIFIITILLSLTVIALRIKNTLKARRWKRLETKWEPVILDVLSGDLEPDQLITKVKRNERLYFVRFLLRFADRLRGKERNLLDELAKPFLPLIAERVKVDNPEHRAGAVQTLSIFGLRDYTKCIIAALNDPSPIVAMLAARSLSRKEFPEYAEAVLSKIHRFESWNRNYLASMLASFGSEAARLLREVFADSKRPLGVRTACAEALFKLNDLASADIATDIVATETDTDLLAAALRLLSKTGRPKHLEAIRVMTGSPDSVVRAHSLIALGELGTTADLYRLSRGLEDSSPWVAIHAARGLKKIGGTELLEKISNSVHPSASIAREVMSEKA